MTLNMDEKKALSDVRMAKAKEFLEDARATFTEGRFRTSVNRSYYAALNAVRALLILEGANPESHEGLITMLSLKFVKPGLLPQTVVKQFKTLLARRTDVDYGDFDALESADAGDSVRIAEEIIVVTDREREWLVS